MGARAELPGHNAPARHLRRSGRYGARTAHGQRGYGGPPGRCAGQALSAPAARLEAGTGGGLRAGRAGLLHCRRRAGRGSGLELGSPGLAHDRRLAHADSRARPGAPRRSLYARSVHAGAGAAARSLLRVRRRRLVFCRGDVSAFWAGPAVFALCAQAPAFAGKR